MKTRPEFDSDVWARENFGGCELNDKRRSQRLVKFARQAADQPASSLPKIGEDWGGTKGIYRLLDCPDATLESVTETHRRNVLLEQGQFLVVSDTSHIDMGWQRNLANAGPIGPGKGKGFLLHSGLLLDAKDGSLIGLAAQSARIRSPQRQGKQNDSVRAKRWRESEMWPELMEQVGAPSEGAEYIHVCDSAADTTESFVTAVTLNTEFVIRVGRHHRNVLVDDEEMPLSAAYSRTEELGQYDLEVGQGNGRKARTVRVIASAKRIELQVPKNGSRRIKQHVANGGGNITAWVVRAVEANPPKNADPIDWTLLSTVPVESFDDAWKVISWYEHRWLIEEWHKALKSGCKLESRQLQDTRRLLPLIGVLSVVAVLLIQLKQAAKTNPEGKAKYLVPNLWLKLLKAKRKVRTTSDATNREFWRAVAKLGGFLGRKHDGEPGWQTIWRGWQELHTLAEGAQLLPRTCG